MQELLPDRIETAEDLQEALARHRYLADMGLARACFLALRLQRPLFLEGEPGTGKTEVAKTLAAILGAPLIRLQCYEGIDASQALYDWDFSRQLLHLRAVEALGRGQELADLEHELFDRRFLIARPLLTALETTPSVLLLDEIDRADDEFEAFLLEVLSDFTVSIPEIGTVHARVPPVVVITSNRTREVHDALKRRCFYHWLDHPSFEREVDIVGVRVPEASRELAEQITTVVHALRDEDLFKPPGVAETLDWVQAIIASGHERAEPDITVSTLGAALKYREDQERALGLDFAALLDSGSGRD